MTTEERASLSEILDTWSGLEHRCVLWFGAWGFARLAGVCRERDLQWSLADWGDAFVCCAFPKGSPPPETGVEGATMDEALARAVVQLVKGEKSDE